MKSILSFILSLSCIFNYAQSYENGNQLITAMHYAYAGKFYKYMSFSQNMTYYNNDTVSRKDIWHEVAEFPGTLSIKFKTKDSKKGVMFKDHQIYSFSEKGMKKGDKRVHELLLLGMDVYFYKPEYTCHILDSLGFNLNQITMNTYNNRPVYIVGAQSNDTTSNQFWIDAERLYLHRIINKSNNNISDTQFDNYVEMDNNWVAKTVRFKINGKLVLVEDYYDIKLPKKLNPDYFNPDKFVESKFE
ncbi:MAG: hypothetical protein AB7O73_07550 [Bacteroidia bacterium]